MPSRGYLNFEYKPISLNEWLAPAMMATQYQRELEDKYLQLQTEASAWDKIKANEQDSRLYENVYKPYLDAINQGAEELTSRGSNPNSRKKLYALTAQYNQVIKPIEEAYTKREQEQAKWREAQYKNPNLMIEKEPGNFSLEDFMNGTYTMPQIIDKEQVYKNALTSFQPLAKAIRKDPQWERMNNGYWAIRTQKGYTPEEIKEAIVNPESADPLLRSAVNSVISSSGALNWSDPSKAVDAIIPVVNQALIYAMGSADTEYKDDLDYKNQLSMRTMGYQAALNMNYLERKAQLERDQAILEASLKGGSGGSGSGSGKKGDSGFARFPSVTSEDAKNNKAYNKAWDVSGVRYEKGQWIRGNTIITDKETKALYDKYKNAYPYLSPEEAIYRGASIDNVTSLSRSIGAHYTSSDNSAKNTIINMLQNLSADGNTNFYSRKTGKPISQNQYNELVAKAKKDDNADSVPVTMDNRGLHIKIGNEWYDSILPDGRTSAKPEIANANKYISTVYNSLLDFSDDGIEIPNGFAGAYGILADPKTQYISDKFPLKHIRGRLIGDKSGTLYNFILDTSTGQMYSSDSYDIENGGNDFANTMFPLYESKLYDVMSTFNGL